MDSKIFINTLKNNTFNESFKYSEDMPNVKDDMETQNITKSKIS